MTWSKSTKRNSKDELYQSSLPNCCDCRYDEILSMLNEDWRYKRHCGLAKRDYIMGGPTPPWCPLELPHNPKFKSSVKLIDEEIYV